MDLQEGRQSENLEDRRGVSGRKLTLGGAIVGLIVLLVGSWLGVNPQLLNQLVNIGQGGIQVGNQGDDRPPTAEEERSRKFYSTILAFTEDVWTEQFQKAGHQYKAPHMVLFTDRVETGCGDAPASVGP